MGKIYRCLILEDEPHAVTLLRRYLKSCQNISVASVASTIAEAHEIIKKERFDLLFFDLHLPDGSSFSYLRNKMPNIPVIVITGDRGRSLEAFDLNAMDYLLKPINQARVSAAVEKALNFIRGRELTDQTMKGNRQNKIDRLAQVLKGVHQLTETECSICLAVAAGKSLEEIQDNFTISENTCKTHLRNIYRKVLPTTEQNHEGKSRHGHGKFRDLTFFLMSRLDSL